MQRSRMRKVAAAIRTVTLGNQGLALETLDHAKAKGRTRQRLLGRITRGVRQ